jgi:hypothetical protein
MLYILSRNTIFRWMNGSRDILEKLKIHFLRRFLAEKAVKRTGDFRGLLSHDSGSHTEAFGEEKSLLLIFPKSISNFPVLLVGPIRSTNQHSIIRGISHFWCFPYWRENVEK